MGLSMTGTPGVTSTCSDSKDRMTWKSDIIMSLCHGDNCTCNWVITVREPCMQYARGDLQGAGVLRNLMVAR